MSYQRHMFDILCAYPHGLSAAELASKLYHDRADGGPLSDTIKTLVQRFNKDQMRHKTGIRIRCYCRGTGRPSVRGGKGGNPYRVWIVRECAQS